VNAIFVYPRVEWGFGIFVLGPKTLIVRARVWLSPSDNFHCINNRLSGTIDQTVNPDDMEKLVQWINSGRSFP
jgi:hypothetical protein